MIDNPEHSERNELDQEQTEAVFRREAIGRVGAATALTATGGLSVAVGEARADAIEETWKDDFEDGNIDGWSGGNPSISSETFDQDYSIEVPDGSPETEWDAGPFLDLSEAFTIEGRVRSKVEDTDYRTRLGLFPDEGDKAILVFSDVYNATFLGTSIGEDPDDEDLDTVSHGLNDEWVNFRIESDGEGTLQASVWESGTTRPDDPQLERDFTEATESLFGIQAGSGSHGRTMYLEWVEITGFAAVDENLELDVPSWMEFGQTDDYVVTWTDPETGDRSSVTDEASVTSPNPDVVSVDEETQTITATSDTEIAERITLRAEYDEADGAAFKDVTVAPISVENIDILPPWRRIQATMTDNNILSIVVALLGGVAGSHLATSFAGLGFATIVTVIAWFGGWLSTGMTMVALFTALFIGFNMAANIDYQVRS